MKRIAVVLLAGALAGCGVPQEDVPRALERDDAPFRVFEPDVAPSPQGDLQIELWFVLNGQAVPVERSVELPGSPRQVVEQLLNGPTETELSNGFSSAIPTSLELRDVAVDGRVAVVTFEELNEQVQVEAYAQIVASLDGRPSVDGVRFRDADGDASVPNGEGLLGAGAVSQDDYAVLLGLAPATPAPAPPAPSPSAG